MIIAVDLLEPFSYEFFRNGLVIATLAGALCGLIGVFVVLRGMSYIGHGLSHAVFGGAALAAVLNLSYFLGAGLWGLASGLMIGRVARKRIIGADAAIGVITTASFAMGLALQARFGQAKQSIDAVLFGNVLGVFTGDILAVAKLSSFDIPIILCGDFNSMDHSSYVFNFYTNPTDRQRILKSVANCCGYTDVDWSKYPMIANNLNLNDKLSNPLKEEEKVQIIQSNDTDNDQPTQILVSTIPPSMTSSDKLLFVPRTLRPSFMCDSSLTKICNLLRVLGFDCSIECKAEVESKRSSEQARMIFRTCQTEGRILLTTSTHLTLMRECPPMYHLISNNYSKNTMIDESLSQEEDVTVRILKEYPGHLNSNLFLTRCVKCNSLIERPVDRIDFRVVSSFQFPTLPRSESTDIFICTSCNQLYWWSESEKSSAAMALGKARRIIEATFRLQAIDYSDSNEENEIWQTSKIVDCEFTSVG